MKVKREFILNFILMIMIISVPTNTFANEVPNITSPNAILMDYTTGKVLYNKNAYKQTYPASTTKIMTAIIVIEKANLDDTVVIDYIPSVKGSSMNLQKGEEFTVKELLQGLLIKSGNDVAEALAIHTSGSVGEFVKLMNERAKELGALNTNFTNPHGLPDSEHITTAYDLAMIAKHAMQYDLFREIVSTPSITFEATKQTPQKRNYTNTNKFLHGTGKGNQILHSDKYIDIKYDIIDGIKTGYTGDAGSCLVSSGIKDNHRLIAVVLGAKGISLYKDSRSLIDYGYNNYKLIPLRSKDSDYITTLVEGGEKDFVNLVVKDDKNILITNSENDLNIIKEDIILNSEIKAPIKEGELLGRILYYLNDEVIEEVDLVAKEKIEENIILENGTEMEGTEPIRILELLVSMIRQIFTNIR